MPTWVQGCNDTFSRADTSPGSAGSTTGVGNGWIDADGGIWSLSGGKLVSVTTAGDYYSNGLVRPVGEATVNQRIVATFEPNSGNFGVILREQANGDHYSALNNNGDIHAYSVVGGAISALNNTLLNLTISGYDATHRYQFDVSVTDDNTGLSTIVAVITDLTTSTQAGTATGADTTFAMRGAGVAGVTKFSPFSPVSASAVVTYSDGGGSPSPLSAGILSLDSEPTGTTVTLDYGATAGGTAPYTLALHRSTTSGFTPGPGTLVAAGVTFPRTDTPPTTPAGQVYWYKVRVTDAASATADSYQCAAVLTPVVLSVIFVGDSITHGTVGDSSPVTACAALLSKYRTRRRVVTSNQGVSGTGAVSWTEGATDTNNALAAWAAMTPPATHVSMMLGTNDARNLLDTPTFAYNLAAAAKVWTDRGVKVILHHPPLQRENVTSGTAAEAANAAMVGYWPAIDGLVNGTTILRGDTLAPLYLADHADEMREDGIHTQPAGDQSLAAFWSAAILDAVDPPATTVAKFSHSYPKRGR